MVGGGGGECSRWKDCGVRGQRILGACPVPIPEILGCRMELEQRADGKLAGSLPALGCSYYQRRPL